MNIYREIRQMEFIRNEKILHPTRQLLVILTFNKNVSQYYNKNPLGITI